VLCDKLILSNQNEISEPRLYEFVIFPCIPPHFSATGRLSLLVAQNTIYLSTKEGVVMYNTDKTRRAFEHQCSQMSGLFYRSVTHGLGFYIFFMI